MARKLGDLVGALPQAEVRHTQVDVSEFFDEEPGTVVFEYREPTIAMLFASQRDADQMLIENPMWPREMANAVSLLALCHVAPESDGPVGREYIRIAEQHGQLFMRLSQGFWSEFSDLRNLGVSADAAKNA